ncbi:hypothetical protein LYZ77_20495, partial [Xanthomonas hortorum pv. vitians]|uniref:hypothetical protein n=1 Tax=Xanthomonas hortorum TaxID=56454 RepID=UPI001F273529
MLDAVFVQTRFADVQTQRGSERHLQIFLSPSCQLSVPGLGLGVSRRVSGKKKPPILLDGGFR